VQNTLVIALTFVFLQLIRFFHSVGGKKCWYPKFSHFYITGLNYAQYKTKKI